jgi:hypothetical protein
LCETQTGVVDGVGVLVGVWVGLLVFVGVAVNVVVGVIVCVGVCDGVKVGVAVFEGVGVGVTACISVCSQPSVSIILTMKSEVESESGAKKVYGKVDTVEISVHGLPDSSQQYIVTGVFPVTDVMVISNGIILLRFLKLYSHFYRSI